MNEFDICRNRHGGNAESEAANAKLEESGAKTRQRAAVLAAIRNSGKEGLTCRELANSWGKSMNEISGRFSELYKNEKIWRRGRRDGCAVNYSNDMKR